MVITITYHCIHLLHFNGHHHHQHHLYDIDRSQYEVQYEQLHVTLPLLGLQAADGATPEEVAFCNIIFTSINVIINHCY